MTKEELIAELEKLPKGCKVLIGDIRKNLHEADEDPCGAGLYEDFSIDYHKDGVDLNGRKHPFATLTFLNDDYTEEGGPNFDSEIFRSFDQLMDERGEC